MVTEGDNVTVSINAGPFAGYGVVHCHLLIHEDEGCMHVVRSAADLGGMDALWLRQLLRHSLCGAFAVPALSHERRGRQQGWGCIGLSINKQQAGLLPVTKANTSRNSVLTRLISADGFVNRPGPVLLLCVSPRLLPLRCAADQVGMP